MAITNLAQGRRIRISLLGPPGVGKGTYSCKIAEYFNIPHISTGDLLRQEVFSGSELGKESAFYISKGLLVPDRIINQLLFKRLSQLDCRNGFVLDGYPRTLSQAQALENSYPLDGAVILQAPLDVILFRISGRLYCPVCGEVYHEKWRPPSRLGVCDKCGSRLIKREDDREEVVARRYIEYLETITPVIEFYRKNDKLLIFDASCDAKEGISLLIKEIENFMQRLEK